MQIKIFKIKFGLYIMFIIFAKDLTHKAKRNGI